MTGSQAGMDGTLVRELRLLLETLMDRGGPWLDRVSGVGAGGSRHEPASCQWCPLCAALALARGDRSELAVRASEQVASLVAMLREFVESGDVPRHGPGEPGGSHEPRVQRIPVRGAQQPVAAPAGAEPRPAEPPESGRVQHIAVRRREPGER